MWFLLLVSYILKACARLSLANENRKYRWQEEEIMSDKENEVRKWVGEVMDSFVKNVRGDDYHKWPEEYGNYFYDCLQEIKPRIAEEIVGTVVDPRNGKGVTDTLIAYLIHGWDYDSDAGTN